jgi:hypothetical protein
MGLRSTILTCSLERQPTHRLRYRCLVTGIKANRKGSFSAEVTHGISGTFPDEAIRRPSELSRYSAGCSRAWSPLRMAPNCQPKRPDGMPTKGPGPFNAHSQDGEGSGLVQHVLCSPARIPAADPSRRGPCAAPASIKRCTLSCARLTVGEML